MSSVEPEDPDPPIPNPASRVTGGVFAFAQRAGKWGIPGIALICASSVVNLVREPTWDHFESTAWTISIGLSLVGILTNTKKIKDLTVTSAASAEINHATVLNAVTGPATANVAPQSVEPAVEREIQKQVRETQEGVKIPNG